MVSFTNYWPLNSNEEFRNILGTLCFWTVLSTGNWEDSTRPAGVEML